MYHIIDILIIVFRSHTYGCGIFSYTQTQKHSCNFTVVLYLFLKSNISSPLHPCSRGAVMQVEQSPSDPC